MHILVDTNVVLDVLCERQPFVTAAQALWIRVESGEVRASLVATTITTVFYLARKHIGTDAARSAVADLLQTFDICPVDRTVLLAAVTRPMTDFEDAVADAAAELSGVTTIVTRNIKDFAGSTLRVVDPETFVLELENVST